MTHTHGPKRDARLEEGRGEGGMKKLLARLGKAKPNDDAVTCQRTGTTSSILRIIRTHSEAKEMALVETSKGWTTFSS